MPAKKRTTSRRRPAAKAAPPAGSTAPATSSSSKLPRRGAITGFLTVDGLTGAERRGVAVVVDSYTVGGGDGPPDDEGRPTKIPEKHMVHLAELPATITIEAGDLRSPDAIDADDD